MGARTKFIIMSCVNKTVLLDTLTVAIETHQHFFSTGQLEHRRVGIQHVKIMNQLAVQAAIHNTPQGQIGIANSFRFCLLSGFWDAILVPILSQKLLRAKNQDDPEYGPTLPRFQFNTPAKLVQICLLDCIPARPFLWACI